MRYFVSLTLLIMFCTCLSAVDFRVAVGVDALGEFQSTTSHFQAGVKNQEAPTVSAQIVNDFKHLSYGLGADYQFPRSNKKLPEGWRSDLKEMSFIPIYATVLYKIPTKEQVSHDFIGQYGYSIARMDFDPEDPEFPEFPDERYSYKGGWFMGLGTSVNYKGGFFSLLFKVNQVEITNEEFEDGVWVNDGTGHSYIRQLNASIGYRFGI